MSWAGRLQGRGLRPKGFTLVELLVVIAIIALLAAILFPVFAQAKMAAYKVTAISHAKQVGLSLLLYGGDHDGAFPSGLVPNLTTPQEDYRTGEVTPQFPAGWRSDTSEITKQEHSLVWVNAVQPYLKSAKILEAPGARASQISSWNYSLPSQSPGFSSFSFNGLLQFVREEEAASPSQLTLLWQGFGDMAYRGAAYLSPRMNCNGPDGGPCRFNSGGAPQAMATGIPQIISFSYSADYTQFGPGNIHVFVDSSARSVNYGKGNREVFPASTNSPVVWRFLDDRGRIDSTRGAFTVGMGSLRTHNYAAAFCPDNTFQN